MQSVDSLLISTPTTVNTISSNASNSSKELKLDLNIACSLKSNALTKDGANGQRKQRRLDSMDKIVSPVIPQPGAWMRPHRYSFVNVFENEIVFVFNLAIYFFYY